MAQELLTRRQLAEMLGLSYQTLNNRCTNSTDYKDLPVVRINSRVMRYRKSDIEAFLRARRTTQTTAE